MAAFSATAFSINAFSTTSFSFDQAAGAVDNATATTVVPVNFEICDRTGFRVLPGALTRDGYGHYVRGKSQDEPHPQDFFAKYRHRRSADQGPQNAEPDDLFISTSIAPEDL